MKTSVVINGACGRMGRRLVALAHEDRSLRLVAALTGPGSVHLGRDAGELAGVGAAGVTITDKLSVDVVAQAVVDFSTPEGSLSVLKECVARRIPIVVATTGFTPQQRREVEAAAHETAVLLSPNTSTAVNVAFHLVRTAAKMLAGRDWDVEVIERHHRYKKDSPSGTALQFAKLIQAEAGQTELRHGREGLVGERPGHEIGVHAVRAGDNVGEHQIIFGTLGETIEIVQRAHSRDCYARGALTAAKFLADKPAGMYSMDDVLGLTPETRDTSRMSYGLPPTVE